MAGVAYLLTQILLGALCILLFVYVFLDIALLYDVPLVLQYSYPQIFGAVILFRMLTNVKGMKKKELKAHIQGEDKSTAAQNFGYGVLNSVIFSIMILGTWLSAYIMHWLFI